MGAAHAIVIAGHVAGRGPLDPLSLRDFLARQLENDACQRLAVEGDFLEERQVAWPEQPNASFGARVANRDARSETAGEPAHPFVLPQADQVDRVDDAVPRQDQRLLEQPAADALPLERALDGKGDLGAGRQAPGMRTSSPTPRRTPPANQPITVVRCRSFRSQ